MANKFQIVIGATDRGTAVVKKFNARIEQMFKPVTRMQAGFSKLGKEIGNNKIVKGIAALSKGALSLITRFKGLSLAVAGISAAAGATALARLGRDWAFAGAGIQRTANIIGISTTRLQSLSGAAQLFGLDAKDMESGLKSLGDTMEDALYGRNQDALILMQRLGVHMKRTKDGAVDTAAGFLDIARAISKIKNAQAQGLVARTFGMENLLPLLQQGPEGIAKLEEMVKKTGAIAGPGTISKMAELTKKINNLTLAFQGLGNTLGDKVAPGMGKFVDFLTDVLENMPHGSNPLFFGGGPDRPKAKPKPKPRGGSGSWEQGASGSWDGPPGGEAAARARASKMEAVLRSLIPGVDIRSGFRTKEKNDSLPGHAKNSYHLIGEAIDFRKPAGMTKAMIGAILRAAHLRTTELLDEGDHIHWAWGDPARKGQGKSSVAAMVGTHGRQASGAGAAKSEPAHVIVSFKNAPPGTTANVKKEGGTKVGLRVDYSLPVLASP